jgi:hypothetical protein
MLSASPMASVPTARLVPPSRRRAWEDELVRFQIDELNGLYDGLCCATTPADRDRLIARARARIEPIARAAAWIPAAVARAVRATVQAGFEEPEDAFGAALLLLALGPGESNGREWAKGWLGALPADVERILTDLGFDPRSA